MTGQQATNESLVRQLATEGMITAATAARLPWLPRTRGGPPSAATVARWHTEGVELPDGRRVKLEAARLNGKVITSEARLLAFFERQQVAELAGAGD